VRTERIGGKLPIINNWISFVWYFTLAILSFISAEAQDIKVFGKFSSDSIKIGAPVEFYLSAHHPQNTTVLFPDSGFSYIPFEFQKKKFFATQTKNGISKDSAVYFLTSYEIDSVQKLKLPVFVIEGKDSTPVFSTTGTVYLHHLVKSIPDSVPANQLPLKANTQYLNVKWQLNYFLFAISGGVLAITLVMVWVFFGKRIKKYFKLKRLTKGYKAFLLQYEKSVDKLQQDFSTQQAEGSLVIWKKYLESLVNKPYTKFTSKEIRILEGDENLGQSLSAIDRIIYGGVHENFRAPFDSLKDYVHTQYEKKKAEVAHG
jgi:hypothetical protein